MLLRECGCFIDVIQPMSKREREQFCCPVSGRASILFISNMQLVDMTIIYLTRSRLRIFQIAGILGLKVFLLAP